MPHPVAWLAAIAILALASPNLAATPEERLLSVGIESLAGGPAEAGAPARLTIIAKDPASGYPMTGLLPSLWLVPNGGAQEDTRKECAAWVRRLLNAPVAPRGTIDLNGFDVVQATPEGRLALVDPRLNLATANIKAIVEVGGIPSSWAVGNNGFRMVIASEADRTVRLLAFDPFSVIATLPLDAAPTALLARGDDFWIGTSAGELLHLNPDGAVGERLPVGSGRVMLEPLGEFGLVAIAADGKGAFVPEGELAAKRGFATRSAVVGGRFSPLADSVYLLARDGRSLLMIPQDDPSTIYPIPLDREAKELHVDPTGRWLAVVAADGGSASIIGAETNRLRWTIDAKDPVIAAAFSDSFLYLMHTHQGGVTRVTIDPSGETPGVTIIAAGSQSEQPQEATNLPLMARIPEVGMLVASTRDRTAYMVSEDGMQAAMSSLPLRAGVPAGLLLRYRGLRPGRELGHYQATLLPPAGGEYIVVVRIDQPNLVHCARVTVAGDPRQDGGEAITTLPVAPDVTLEVPETISAASEKLSFKLIGAAATPLRAILIGTAGKRRGFATRFETSGDAYALPIRLRGADSLRLFVEVAPAQGGPVTLTADLEAMPEPGSTP